ncbi:MAG: hypothetical protein IT492_06130 [Gammaproteobacteria bacterium]|nr:hypothetical protein [Gammaproteobacteria bacterium]
MALDSTNKAASRHHGFLLFVLCFLSYAYFYQGGGWNQNSRFDLTRAIVEQHSFAIDAYAANTGDVSARAGHIYCDKAPGQSLLAAPVYALFMHGEREPDAARLNDAAYVITLASVALPGALAVWVLHTLLLAFGARAAWAVAVALGYGLATMAWPYSTMLFGHQLVAALLLFAFALLQRDDARAMTRVACAGLCLGLACMVEYQAVLGALAIGVFALRRGLRGAMPLALGALPPLALLAVYHWRAFGAPWTLAYEFSTMPFRHQGFFMGLGVPNPQVLHEITVGAYRGLFYSAPWLLLAVPGLLVWLRRGRAAAASCAAAVVLLYLWMNASLVDWQGGWTYGPRFLVPCLPFMALLAGGVGAMQWRSRVLARLMGTLLAVLLLVSYGATLVATAVNPQTPLGIAQPFADYLLPRWQSGQVSLVQQGIDMKWPRADATPASWNLGQRLGLGGRASLLPLVALHMMLGGALFATGRRSTPSLH